MDKREKSFVKQGIVVPVIVAVIVTALAFGAYFALTGAFGFNETEFALAEYSDGDVGTMENYSPESGSIIASQLPQPGGNTVIGNAVTDSDSIEIINCANDVNSADRLAIDVANGYIGESGGAFLSCGKKNASVIRMLEVGSSIEFELYYGSYEYRVAETEKVTAAELEKIADEYAAAVVLYTDADTRVGISDDYYAVICERVSGSFIKG